MRSSRAKLSDQLRVKRQRRVDTGEGGRADDLSTMRPFTTSWWGRVGELLFLHLYPDAMDSVKEFGNHNPYDAQHRTLGRVAVKTAKALVKWGRSQWSFHLSGDSRRSETMFLVGFSVEQDRIVKAWVAPSNKLPVSLKVMSPGSREYAAKQWEIPDAEVGVLDRKFQSLLSSSGQGSVIREDPGSRVEYERILLGRIGEAIYGAMYPQSDHVASRNPIATYDFTDADGTTVNIRVRRPDGRGRWVFFRSPGCTASVYFFIGLDAEAKNVLAAHRVLATDMPDHGFSATPNGISKWTPLDIGLPRPVSDFVKVGDFEDIHIQIMSLRPGSMSKMTEKESELLLRRAFGYHRMLGFPYLEVPHDRLLESYVQSIRSYSPIGKDLHVDNAGLALCSAYMPHRFSTRNADSMSATESFWNDGDLMRTLEFCVKGEKPSLTRPALRSALTALCRTPTQFRPTITRHLVDTYCIPGGRVLDPCAGWGGRLFGTVVGGRSYVGVEPVKATADALYYLGMRLCEHLKVPRDFVRILESSIQTAPVDIFGGIDFAITSPPYWTKEVYEGTRSSITPEDWRVDFLAPMFLQVYKVLKPGCCFAVNIADVKDGGKLVPLESMAVITAELCGFRLDAIWRMLKPTFGGQESNAHEPIFIFRKDPS